MHLRCRVDRSQLFTRFHYTSNMVFFHLSCGFLLSDILECASNPCHEGSTCIEGFGDYTCRCTEDWKGRNCDAFWRDYDDALLIRVGTAQHVLMNLASTPVSALNDGEVLTVKRFGAIGMNVPQTRV